MDKKGFELFIDGTGTRGDDTIAGAQLRALDLSPKGSIFLARTSKPDIAGHRHDVSNLEEHHGPASLLDSVAWVSSRMTRCRSFDSDYAKLRDHNLTYEESEADRFFVFTHYILRVGFIAHPSATYWLLFRQTTIRTAMTCFGPTPIYVE